MVLSINSVYLTHVITFNPFDCVKPCGGLFNRLFTQKSMKPLHTSHFFLVFVKFILITAFVAAEFLLWPLLFYHVGLKLIKLCRILSRKSNLNVKVSSISFFYQLVFMKANNANQVHLYSCNCLLLSAKWLGSGKDNLIHTTFKHVSVFAQEYLILYCLILLQEQSNTNLKAKHFFSKDTNLTRLVWRLRSWQSLFLSYSLLPCLNLVPWFKIQINHLQFTQWLLEFYASRS